MGWIKDRIIAESRKHERLGLDMWARLVEEKIMSQLKEYDIPSIDLEYIPKCSVCGKEMINIIDSKTKKISPYLWKTTCEHSKGMVLARG